MSKSTDRVPPEVRERACQLREALKHRPPLEELLTPDELADGTRFYFTLRTFVAELRAARQAQGLTLADVASRTGLTIEAISHLETGATVNPTWQILGDYAAAVGCRPVLTAERIEPAESSAV